MPAWLNSMLGLPRKLSGEYKVRTRTRKDGSVLREVVRHDLRSEGPSDTTSRRPGSRRGRGRGREPTWQDHGASSASQFTGGFYPPIGESSQRRRDAYVKPVPQRRHVPARQRYQAPGAYDDPPLQRATSTVQRSHGRFAEPYADPRPQRSHHRRGRSGGSFVDLSSRPALQRSRSVRNPRDYAYRQPGRPDTVHGPWSPEYSSAGAVYGGAPSRQVPPSSGRRSYDYHQPGGFPWAHHSPARRMSSTSEYPGRRRRRNLY